MRFILSFSILISFIFWGCDPKEKEFQPDNDFELKAPAYFGSFNERIPEDNPTTSKGFELGRMLFYEKKLSGITACHVQVATSKIRHLQMEKHLALALMSKSEL